MRRILAACLVFATVCAQAQNFPRNDVNQWAYDALAHLDQCRLMTAPLFVGRDGEVQTRYEFAVATHANVENLSKRLDEKFADFAAGRRDLGFLPKDRVFDELDRLVGRFRREIASLGAAPEDLTIKVSVARKRAADLRLLYVSEVSPRARKNFPDVPENHWAHAVLEELHKLDLFPAKFLETRRIMGPGPVYSAERWAEMIEETVERLPMAASLTGVPEKDHVFDGLARLCRHFEPELKGLRPRVSDLYETIEQVRRTTESRRQALYDVPRAHWASQAIADLHAAGLLHGYPGAKFGG